MMKLNFVLCLLCFCVCCFSQQPYDRRVYIMAPLVGTGVPLNHATGSEARNVLDEAYLFTVNGAAFCEVWKHFGIHTNIWGTGYWYDLSADYFLSKYPNFYVLENSVNYGNVKISLLAGGAYKFCFKRLIIIPFIDIGLIPHATSSLGNFRLKETNSNNIMEVILK